MRPPVSRCLALTGLLLALGPLAAGARTAPDSAEGAASVRVGLAGSSVGARFAFAADSGPVAWPLGRGVRADTSRRRRRDALATGGALAPADTLVLDPSGPPRVNPWRVAVIGGTTAGLSVGVMEYQRHKWWGEHRPTWRLQNDWAYARWADKAAHLYNGAFFTRVYRSALRWAGLPPAQARWWGAGLGWANMTYYEALDGFGPQWGASPGDFLFNTLGVAFATAQDAYPAATAVQVKASYRPSGRAGKNLVEDYEGQTMWLTANPHRLLPATRRVMPPWLNVAVGYGARGRDEQEFLTTSAVYVGLDFEPAGLPLRGRVWEFLVPILQHVHFPAPAVRLSPGVEFVPLAF